MKNKLLLLLLFFCSLVQAQNLVPNPSFEDYTLCPDNPGQIVRATGWTSFRNTPDYYNACSGIMGVPNNNVDYQLANTGAAYSGFFTISEVLQNNYKEYLAANLNAPLVIGNRYYFSCYVSRASNSCITNKIGVNFSTGIQQTYPITNDSKIIFDNSISNDTGWERLSESFIADSAYKFIIIGCFFDDDSLSKVIQSGNLCSGYYFIDDVCLSIDSNSCTPLSIVAINASSDETFNSYLVGENLIIDVNSLQYKSVVCIYNSEGVKVYRTEVCGSSQLIKIDVSLLSDGLYFIVLNSNIRNRSSSFFIHH